MAILQLSGCVGTYTKGNFFRDSSFVWEEDKVPEDFETHWKSIRSKLMDVHCATLAAKEETVTLKIRPKNAEQKCALYRFAKELHYIWQYYKRLGVSVEISSKILDFKKVDIDKLDISNRW